MPANPIARHPAWRQILIVAIAGPVLIALVFTAFAWPTARTAPHDLPVGLVATGTAGSTIAPALDAAGFAVHRYSNRAEATEAIEHRDIYAAVVAASGGTTVLTASAAAPAVATQFATAASALAQGPVRVVDVVPLSPNDPRGAVLASAALPLVFGGMIIAVLVALVLGMRPTWRMLAALVIVSATTGLAAYLIAESWLGVLPGEHLWTWAALTLTVLAISSAVAGLYELVGIPGVGMGSILMLFLGNPFSGITSAPELLPSGVAAIGQWLPPGAGANLLRSTAYFHGHGAAGHATVLVCWVVAGMTAVVVGHARQARGLADPIAQAPGRHEAAAGRLSVDNLAAQG